VCSFSASEQLQPRLPPLLARANPVPRHGSPKLEQRILRFQRFIALAWTLERPSTQLARLAADAGYADQARLTREAKRWSGARPAHCCWNRSSAAAAGTNHAAS